MPSTDPPCCLVTGFEPFDGSAVNPSWLLAQALAGERWHGFRVAAEQLPCRFASARGALDAALRRHRPQLVLALGQAGRPLIGVERVAINVDDSRMPDNDGTERIDLPVQPGGPAAYFSTLPIKAMVAAMRDTGGRAEVSNSAGTYLCNHVFYALMHRLKRRRGTRGGFVHVPMLPEQAAARGLGEPAMALADQQRALAAGLRAAWHTRTDLRVSEGSND